MGIVSSFKKFRGGGKKKKETNPDKEMSFLDHLEELRWHLLRSLAAIMVFAIIIFFNIKYITDNIVFWTFRPDFPLHQWLCAFRDSLCFEEMPVKLITIKPYEQFIKSITLSFIGGLICSFPYFFWEMWRFIRPGLHDNERQHTRGTVFVSSLLFFAGVAFAYFIIVPFAVQFLANYTISDQVDNQWTFGEVITMVVRLVLAGGIMFELPIVIYFLSKAGLVTPETLKKYRRHAIVVLLLLSAVITPPDITSQILIFIPLYLLYQFSIWISRVVVRKRDAELAAT